MSWILVVLLLALLAISLFVVRREQLSRHLAERKLAKINAELKRIFKHLEEERARLAATFSGMAEGVLVVDEKGDVLHINPTFREMFGIEEKVEGRSPLEVLANVRCDDAIQKVIREKNPVEKEVTFDKPKRRVFQVHFSPTLKEGKLLGVVAIFHDLTEIRHLEEVRRDFIANLSHELKTPLTAIRGFSETLLEDSEPEVDLWKKHVGVIFRHATELTHLTENLLNLSRIESGKEEVLLEAVSLKSFVDRLLERFLTEAKIKKIEIHNEIAEDLDTLEADPAKLAQVLSNLIDNALKYTQEGGKIWIRCKSDDGHTQIEVEDNGPGIPRQEQERIFERFYRIDKARSRQTGGAGLGLAIVKHLVELHGGQVKVSSEPNHGSKFQITLPQNVTQS